VVIIASPADLNTSVLDADRGSGAVAACDLILYLLLLKEKEDDSGPGCP